MTGEELEARYQEEREKFNRTQTVLSKIKNGEELNEKELRYFETMRFIERARDITSEFIIVEMSDCRKIYDRYNEMKAVVEPNIVDVRDTFTIKSSDFRDFIFAERVALKYLR